MPKTKKKTSVNWLFVGLAGALLSAPNATIIRSVVTHDDMFLFNALRFGAVGLVCIPFLLLYFHKLRRGQIMKYAMWAAVCMAVSVTTNVLAINMSTASYVSIVTLITPIVMLVLSVRIIGDKITPRAIAGITLAAIGSMVTILLPIAIHQGGQFVFYPWATVFALINSIAFPLSTIFYRKANEGGAPFMPMMGISAIMIVAANLVLHILLAPQTSVDLAGYNWWAILYSGVAVAFVARTLNTICYEHLGAATVSAISYLGSFFAILIPVVVLGESLSLTMILGGILMFAGLYVIEQHKFRHYKHFFTHARH